MQLAYVLRVLDLAWGWVEGFHGTNLAYELAQHHISYPQDQINLAPPVYEMLTSVLYNETINSYLSHQMVTISITISVAWT